MPAWRIFDLARTSRLAMVGSGTRKARPISPVVRPASVRRVNATWASKARAGWQHVNISRSRSSATPLSSTCGPAFGGAIAISSYLTASLRARRSRSVARFRATVVSHAPGWSGTPSRGQRCSARSNASWAHSSARSQSPSDRMSVATTRPHSRSNTRRPPPLRRLHLPDRFHLDRPMVDAGILVAISIASSRSWADTT